MNIRELDAVEAVSGMAIARGTVPNVRSLIVPAGLACAAARGGRGWGRTVALNDG